MRKCHDCGAQPGTLHQHECGVEQCSNCGGQRVSCHCPARSKRRRLPWTGKWPGEAECTEWGWFCKEVPGVGRVSCSPDDPDAEPDLNRLFKEAWWDRRAGRFLKKAAG